MLKQLFSRLAVKAEHVVVFFGSVGLGAAASYLQLQSSDTLFGALSNAQKAEHLAAGAGVAALIAIVALARKSFLVPVASHVLIAALGLFSAGCPKGATTPTLTPQQIAQGTVLTLDKTWEAASEACLTVARATGNSAMQVTCQRIFAPVGPALIIAAQASDAWSDASQGLVACAVQDVSVAFQSASTFLADNGINVPDLDTAIAATVPWLPQCNRPDAGASDAALDAPPLSPATDGASE